MVRFGTWEDAMVDEVGEGLSRLENISRAVGNRGIQGEKTYALGRGRRKGGL